MFPIPSFRTSLLINNNAELGINEEFDREYNKTMRFAIILVVLSALYIFAAVNAWSELRYTFSGVEIDAHFVRARLFEKNNVPMYLTIKYRFQTPDGRFYNAYCEVDPETWIEPANRTLSITYLASRPTISTLNSERTRLWIFVLLLLVLAPIIWCFKFWRDFTQGKV